MWTLQQEQMQMRKEFSRHEELRNELRRKIQLPQPQLSTPLISEPRSALEGKTDVHGFGFKIKPDTYDGKVPLREFPSQFLLSRERIIRTRLRNQSLSLWKVERGTTRKGKKGEKARYDCKARQTLF